MRTTLIKIHEKHNLHIINWIDKSEVRACDMVHRNANPLKNEVLNWVSCISFIAYWILPLEITGSVSHLTLQNNASPASSSLSNNDKNRTSVWFFSNGPANPTPPDQSLRLSCPGLHNTLQEPSGHSLFLPGSSILSSSFLVLHPTSFLTELPRWDL